MEIQSLVFKIGGKAGQGVLSSGLIFLQALREEGYHTFAWSEYPSLIKGGHNTVSVRVSGDPVNAPSKDLHLLVALDTATIDMHEKDISDGGALIYDKAIEGALHDYATSPNDDQKFYAYGVPLSQISRGINKTDRYVNTVALGAAFAVLCRDFSALEQFLAKRFGKKGEKVVKENVEAAKKGFEYVENEYDKAVCMSIVYDGEMKENDTPVMNGALALAYGAIKAGVSFTAAYPMTPATPVFDALVKNAKNFDIAAKQAEDEISAVLMTVGASYAGARAMTMSSGGGFSLMVEAVGLAGITETPLVIVEAMRGGPSTGLPTKTEQSDLRFVVHASQGEFPRVVLAPGDVNESYVEIQRAFNLADMYQLPVLVLTDKYLGTSEMEFTQEDLSPITPDRGMIIKSKDELGEAEYQRYLVTDDGVSPRAYPGTPGITFKSGSDEHNENGEISEDPHNRIEQMDKRMRKLESLLPELPKPKVYGDEKADVTLITWGSNKNICLEAADMLRAEGKSVNVLHFIYLYPLDVQKVGAILDEVKVGVMVEVNKTGQFAGMLAEYIGYRVDHKFLKYTGEPVYPEEIAEFVTSHVK